MGAQTLLAPTTAASQSNAIGIESRRRATFILFAAAGLSPTQFGDVQISHDGGVTWQDLFQDGAQVRLSSTNNAVTVYGPGVFRVDKEATTNATGVWCSMDNNL